MPSNRIGRINEEIQRELAALIRTVKDPRVHGLVSVTAVDTTPDLRYAKIYVSVLDKSDVKEVVKGLKSAGGYLRRELGRALRWNKVFPEGANVNFYEITGEDLIFERTFERGVEDFTYACGTGTGSVVTVLTLQGKVSGHGVQVDMTGGRLVIDAERVHSHIASLYLTGPTNVVCRGEVTDEDLIIM